MDRAISCFDGFLSDDPPLIGIPAELAPLLIPLPTAEPIWETILEIDDAIALAPPLDLELLVL